MIPKLIRHHHIEPMPRAEPKALWFLSRLFAVLMAVIAPVSTAFAQTQTASTVNATQHAAYDTMTTEELSRRVPAWPNPYLSFLPAEASPDYAYWREVMKRDGARRAMRQKATLRALTTRLIAHIEDEAPGNAGLNDTTDSSEYIAGLGTGTGDDREAEINGEIAPLPPATTVSPAPAEDDGDLTKAKSMGLTDQVPGQQVKTVSAQIGDGPFGASSGDYDCYAATAQAGQSLVVDFANPSGLNFVMDLYRSAGERLGTLNPQLSTTFRSFLTAPFSDTYTLCVRALLSGLLQDPLDSSSGRGASDTGPYQLTLSAPESDAYGFDLDAGDVIGASMTGGDQTIVLIGPDLKLLVASSQDVSGIYPDTSPLPGGNDAVFAYVAPTAGRYTLKVTGAAGAYRVRLSLFRPPLESATTGELRAQRLFLDFDGATLNTTELFGAPQGFEAATLSPILNFLSAWGLRPTDEGALIDAIIAVVTENLSEDIRKNGNNGDRDTSTNAGEFDIEILNSRDHIDPFGEPDVSRVIIGGSRDEAGIATIGMAEHVDPGHFQHSSSALVLLDLLSAAAFDPNSLNQFSLDSSVTKIDLVARAVGNLASHEAGHLFGNFHTDNANTQPEIMDLGGNMANVVGIGVDGIFGTADDLDVDLNQDAYLPSEGFLGNEDTLNTVAFGLSTGPNTLPTISPIADQRINQNESTGPIPFSIDDADAFDAPGNLELSAASDNSALVPLVSIVFDENAAFTSDTAHTITVTPVAGRSGTAQITVTVSDGQGHVTESFRLLVGMAPNAADEGNALSAGGGGGCTLRTDFDADYLLPGMLTVACLVLLRRKSGGGRFTP